MKQNSLAPLEGGPTFSLSHRLFRATWNIAWLILCSWTPPILWRWRVAVLRAFGANVSLRCDVRGSARVWYPPNLTMSDRAMLAERVQCYNVASVSVGIASIVSQGAYLCTASHDIRDPDFPLTARPITIGNGAWVATEAFLGPGVSVADRAVLGARSCAFSDLEADTVYGGNPAQPISIRVP